MGSKNFLKLDKVDGASKDQQHLGWIDVYSWRWSDSPDSLGESHNGTAQKATQEIKLIAPNWDAAADVYRFRNYGSHLHYAVLRAISSDGSLFSAIMTDVMITGVREGAGGPGATESLIEVTLYYQKVSVFRIPMPSAAAVKMVDYKWS